MVFVFYNTVIKLQFTSFPIPNTVNLNMIDLFYNSILYENNSSKKSANIKEVEHFWQHLISISENGLNWRE